MQPVKVDIWSDIACPWCYIGKRRFEAGVALFRQSHPDVDVQLEYHSFQLAPDLPVEFPGSELDYLVQRKGLPEAQVRRMLDSVTDVARSEGLAYDFDALQPTNTAKAHELLHHAKALGKQSEAKERLLAAHFVEGRHVGRLEELADLAAEVGLDRAEALVALQAGVHADAVRADLRQAAALGIAGVPFYVIDARFGVSGAQPAEMFAEVLRRAVAERQVVS